MKIEYMVGNKAFNTKQGAQEYITNQATRECLVVLTGPDLTEGRYGCNTMNLFEIDSNEVDEAHQTTDTLKKLVENALSEKMRKVGGIMGTLQMLTNFSIVIVKEETMNDTYDSFRKVKQPTKFELNKIPYDFEDAMNYVREVLSPLLNKR